MTTGREKVTGHTLHDHRERKGHRTHFTRPQGEKRSQDTLYITTGREQVKSHKTHFKQLQGKKRSLDIFSTTHREIKGHRTHYKQPTRQKVTGHILNNTQGCKVNVDHVQHHTCSKGTKVNVDHVQHHTCGKGTKVNGDHVQHHTCGKGTKVNGDHVQHHTCGENTKVKGDHIQHHTCGRLPAEARHMTRHTGGLLHAGGTTRHCRLKVCSPTSWLGPIFLSTRPWPRGRQLQQPQYSSWKVTSESVQTTGFIESFWWL